jgi:hypothetical protein
VVTARGAVGYVVTARGAVGNVVTARGAVVITLLFYITFSQPNIITRTTTLQQLQKLFACPKCYISFT